ncbi:unnamed protein product, partial [Allacma fusca]
GIGGRGRRGGDRQCLQEKKYFGHNVQRGVGLGREREYIIGGVFGRSRGGIRGLDQNPTILQYGGCVQDEHS